LRREKAVVNQHILEFKGANESIVVSVKSLESFPQIEEGSSVESLSDAFRGSFVADDFVQNLLEEVQGLFTENLIIEIRIMHFKINLTSPKLAP